MSRTRSIAAAQSVPVRGDVDANVDSHLRLAEVAASEGAEVLVFPELSLTGYELELAEALAFTEADPRLAPLRELAAFRQLTLVVGAPIRLGPRLHLGAFLLGRDHSVAIYTKQHLGAFAAGANPGGQVPPAEHSVFVPGDLNPLVPCASHSAAVAICADTSRASHVAAAAESGAESYLASMFFTPPELESEAARLRGFAAEQGLAVAMANFGGPTGGLLAAGGSAIWSDAGELLAQLDGGGSGIVVAHRDNAGWRGRAIVLA